MTKRQGQTAVPKGEFDKGEMVRARACGLCGVLAGRPMGNDALLEIAFDETGTKRLMANTAGAHMEKL